MRGEYGAAPNWQVVLNEEKKMKKVILLTFLLVIINLVQAQQKAVTETGEEVILHQDGTWQYENEQELVKSDIQTSSRKFEKDKESTFLLKSGKIDVGFYLNPKLWSFKKATDNPEAEYELQLKEGDLYGMIVTEKVEIPLETLRSIALENARDASPDIKIIKEEYRIVNGVRILFIQLKGTTQGIKFSYYGYYYSSSRGTVQFITYTSQNLLDSYIPDCENLLNGFVEIN
jgi:hypothetical protein